MSNLNQAHLDIAAASHPGLVGKNNEDRYGVSAFMTGAGGKVPALLAVLCDGIGGHRAGEIAAQLGVTTVTEVITASDGLQPLETLENAIQRANHAIFEASLSVQGHRGMGTTCVCAWVIADRLYTSNLGDSRIYLLRGEHILQLTTDHTWLQEAYDAGSSAMHTARSTQTRMSSAVIWAPPGTRSLISACGFLTVKATRRRSRTRACRSKREILCCYAVTV